MKYVDLFFQYLMKKRWLHYVIGLSASSILYLELNKPKIPDEASPDYSKIANEQGETMKLLTGYVVDVFGGGPNYIAILVLTTLILFCIYAEIKINMPEKPKGKSIKNIFSGWFQVNNQTNYYDKDE
ncbi:hypothetical protein [Flavobacterium sp. NRK1]|uniref:hypothetical protein n=1 Tax=Flavobacterium sp. NRK1 TaxID=2954929 RepID=UPI002092DD62|nr:hypothetical protein [Flavobacterium sp. NRK1]MCO6148947.1 hypothetical protein [Flavobacterium sp. NRK1]